MQCDAILKAQQPLLCPAQVCVALVPGQAAIDSRQVAVDGNHGSVEDQVAFPLQRLLLPLQPESSQ